MANDEKLIEAIQLIKAGQKDAARAVLEPFLLKNPNHIQAWMWETELFSSDREKVRVLEACLNQNPGNAQVTQALAFFSKRAGISAQPPAPKPVTPSYSPPPIYPEPTSSSYYIPESAQSTPAVSPFSDSPDLRSSAFFDPEPEPEPVRMTPIAAEKPVRSQPLPQKSAPPKKKSKPLPQAAKTAILVGLGIVACIVLTGFYVGGGYYLNSQVEQAFAVQNCADVVQQTTFVSLYPRAIFGSMFAGHDQYAQCRSKVDLQQAIEQKNWEQATSIAQGYLAAYPTGPFAQSFQEQTPKILSTWAAELIANHNSMAGIEKLKQLISTYPNSPAAQTAPDTILQTYLSSAKALSDKNSYKDAESSLKTALNYFKDDQARSDQIKQELATLYVAWGNNQVQLGDIDGATATYQKAVEVYPGSVDIDLLIARANLQKAVEISKTKNFNKALDRVKEILDTAQRDNIKAEANATREEILKAYSASSSPQAMEQLTAAISTACQGQRPELPIFGLNPEKVGFGFTNGFVQWPEELAPKTPGELHYVICAVETEDTLQKCPYQGGHFVLRIQYIWQMTIYDMLSGEVVNTGKIYGAEPKACPPVAYLAVGSTTSKSYGQRPTSDQIVAWLTKLNLIK
jgi:tetratricopeptide (TPR) repeat protein